MLTFPTPPSPSPPPPPIPPPSPAIPAGDSHHSSAPSLLIIVAIIAFVITASASIHLLLRLIARSRSSSSSSSSSPPSPRPLLPAIPVSPNQSEPSDRDKLISSLPIFTLSSLQKSQSLDCAVCLSNFRPDDELRLLPACRHAFHSQCVDTWLRSTPSCPLCRASIHFHPTAEIDPSRSGSFRVEIGSVSRRTPAGDGISTGHARSYSLGSSFEYLVEDDVEAVLERMRRGMEGKPENGIGAPGSEIAEVAGSGRRGWIRDVVDRIASSASSSFNSLRFSGRIGGNQVDLEANSFVEWEEESGFAVFYRWLAGV